MEKLQPYEGNEPYIFASYSHEDSETVIPFLEAMKRDGYRLWYDNDIPVAERWKDIIATHIEKCAACVVFYSDASGKSYHCQHEIEYVVDNRKTAMVFYLEDIPLTPGLRMYLNHAQSAKKSKYPTPEALIGRLKWAKGFQPCKGQSEAERQEAERIRKEEEQREAERQELERLRGEAERMRQELERLRKLEAELRERERQEAERLGTEHWKRPSPQQWTSQPRSVKHAEPIFLPPRQNIMDEKGGILFRTYANALIGYGKYSQVYKGELSGSGRTVAVKVYTRALLRPTRQHQDEFPKVKRKVEWLKMLKHPGIAEFIEWIPDFQNNRSYIVMQYIEGRGLNQELVDKGSFRQARVLNWAFRLLDAMQYLHDMRYIIGPLDPSNIVLTPEDNVCLVDFKYLSDIRDTFREKVKYYGRYENTPEGNQALEYGMREDIRYFGATLFELLTGQKPGGLMPEQRHKALSENGVSDSVSDVILRAMSPEAKNRYASAAEMKRDLMTLPMKDRYMRSQIISLALTLTIAAIMLLWGIASIITGLEQIAYEAKYEARTTVYTEESSSTFADTLSGETDCASDTTTDEVPAT